MMKSNLNPLGLSLLCVALGFTLACTNGPIKTDVGVNAASSRCKQQPEQTVKIQAGVEAGFQQGMLKMGGKAGYEQLVEVKNKFDTLQSDYAQMSYQLCEDSTAKAISQKYYERRRECLDQALIAMRAMDMVLSEKLNAAGETPSEFANKEATWELESKLSWLQEILACPKEGAAISVSSNPRPEENITLTAYLICQRKIGTKKFVDVAECTETPLKEGDRVKIGFRSDRDARFYVFNYNDTGLFQMIFPDRGIANELEAGRDYIIPPDDWLELDDQKNVTERLQVVASLEKIQQLEDLRGAYFEPKASAGGSKPKRSKAAVKTRGLLEPVLTRGFKQKGRKAVKLDVGAKDPVETVPMVVTKPGVNVIEFNIIHK
jgi:hypothetical protein